MAAEGSGAGASSAGSGAASAGGPPPAKRARQETPAVEGTWGCVADDVAAAVDWSALTKAFDEFTSARLWALRVTSADLAERLPLLVVGERRLLLEVLAGEDAAQTATSSRPCSQPAASDRPPRFALSSHLTLRRAEGRGRGWFARAGLAAGTVVLVEKPVVATLDAEWRNEDWAGSDGADTTALGLELAHCFSPGLGAVLANLHPQPGAVPPVPRDAEGGQDSSDSEEDEAALCAVMAQAWGAVEGPSEEEKERLRRVVQLNSLGFYTNSEQLCHHGNFTALTGSGLYALASGFNHSCDPNVARFSIGDVTAFVTNRPVEAGGELCISYIESELLCAPKSVRAQSLNRDFTCGCTRCDRGQGESFPVAGQRRYLLVDEQLQASLALLPSENRVDTVRAFLSGDLSGAGAGGSEEEEEEEEEAPEAGPLVILGKDAQELRVVEAVAFMQLQKYEDALLVWRRLAAFTCHHCPPFDEALAVYAVQAALCALAVGNGDMATSHAATAAIVHRVVCGADLFRWRYRVEVESATVSEEVKKSFWELPFPSTSAPVAWDEVVAAWKFAETDVPKAYDVV
uniref:SET domain-containing protein n=1 Tax=Alexandrium monilatum TaxID=311494 RepID=A0A7S4SVW8_9DINO